MKNQLQTPVPHEQHGTRSTPPLNALKLRIIELLKAGKTYEEITDETDATRYLVIKVSQQMVGKELIGRGLFPSPAANRTTCTRKPGCECVWHRAEAERERRLAAKRKGVLNLDDLLGNPDVL